MSGIRVAILTISDRASRGEYTDLSGPAIEEFCLENHLQVIRKSIIPDDFDQIKAALVAVCSTGDFDLVLTTGGTGFSPRDVTPEATLAVIERLTPGIPEAMRAASLAKTPFAMISRAVSGIRGSTWIINLPGSPKAAVENLAAVASIIPHAVDLLRSAGNVDHPPSSTAS